MPNKKVTQYCYDIKKEKLNSSSYYCKRKDFIPVIIFTDNTMPYDGGICSQACYDINKSSINDHQRKSSKLVSSCDLCYEQTHKKTNACKNYPENKSS